MARLIASALCLWLAAFGVSELAAQKEKPWRQLPLINDGEVDRSWTQIGFGRFVVDKDCMRSECDEKGMGLLVYEKERFANCQIRVVYRTKDGKSNSGVYVRIDEGILKQTEKPTALVRGPDGKLTREMLQKIMDMSERDIGPWYAVHHGYEVQICDDADDYHRTGAIYSLSKAAELPKSKGEWRTMIITLNGNKVSVDVNGKRISNFDSESADVPARKVWHEPRREPKRPTAGYIGLQTHDPGDVVYFKEISVRPLKNS